MDREDHTTGETMTRLRSTTTDDEPWLGEALAAADVGLLLYDGDDRVAWVNAAVPRLFGLSGERVVGMVRRRLLVDHLAPVAADERTFTARALDTDRTGTRFLASVGTDAGQRWLDARSQPLSAGPQAARIELYSDVTEYVRTAHPVRELARIVGQDAPFTDRLADLLELGSDLLELPYGFVTAIDDRTQTIVESVGDHDLLQPGESCQVMESYCRKTLANERVVAIPDASDDGWEEDPAYRTFQLESYVGVPVDLAGGNYGTLCFAGPEPRGPFTDDEELFVEVAGTWVGYELDRLG